MAVAHWSFHDTYDAHDSYKRATLIDLAVYSFSKFKLDNRMLSSIKVLHQVGVGRASRGHIAGFVLIVNKHT